MEVKMAADTRAALDADLTIRCLCDTKYSLESCHSQIVIPWARDLAQAIAGAVLKALGRPETQVDVQMNMVSLTRLRNTTSLFCFDLFLDGCSDHTRAEVASSLQRPIHVITK
ncbi:hypothetical protein B0H63DRAFT_526932 [Podospora didyma]|uniref:Uncharacterized protein n=1 Tax=Podospora didyma TaxID=330526 RepID=A0AAE0K8I2_9PEZI|nr:hypothetical protein B0H63DRAFT_526932 [Podospora didyma]